MKFFDDAKKIFNDFKGAVENDGPLIVRTAKANFHKTTMSSAQKRAYEEILFSVKNDQSSPDVMVVNVPAHVMQKDAEKALKQIRLESDLSTDIHVVWAARPDKKTILSEKPPRP